MEILRLVDGYLKPFPKEYPHGRPLLYFIDEECNNLVTSKKRSRVNGCNGEVLEQKKGSWIVPQRMKGWLVEDARTMANANCKSVNAIAA